MNTKQCNVCKETKPTTEFNSRSDNGKLRNMCKTCHSTGKTLKK